MLRRAIMAGNGNTDPYWANVVTLHNFPGADGYVGTTDATGKGWSAAGFEVDTSLGYNAGLFSATIGLEAGGHSGWAMGTGDFTIEAWIYPTTVSGDRAIFAAIGNGGAAFGITGGKLHCGPTGVSYGLLGATTVSTGGMVHAAVCRQSGTKRIFLGGIIDASGSDTYNYVQSGAMIGANRIPPSASVGRFAGWMRAVRVTKGVARYTANFTPSAAPFPTS